MYLIYPYARFYPARLRLFVDAVRQGISGMGVVDLPSARRHGGERTRRPGQ
ncbi:Transcriptional regulator, LysR family [Cupriavidus necator H850]|nr:Transcriptional regulator, LysR family [Cupriavidus necator H850]